jgi:VCBS repeat-containing protein
LDGDVLTAAKMTDPAHGIVSLNANGGFTYTPGSNYFGADSFTYQASDGIATSTSAIVSLTITNLNRAPVANAESYTLGKNGSFTIAGPGVLGNDTDADGDTLTAVKLTDPTHGIVNLNANGGFTYTPASNYSGSDSFTYQANDGAAGSASATVSLTITNINRAPVANNDSYGLNKSASLTVSGPGVLGNDTDADGDALTAIKITDPAHGSLNLNVNGAFTYTPVSNYFGADNFTYRASDGLATSAVATVSLTITNVNHAPVLGNDSFTNSENIPFSLPLATLLTNDYDPDGDPLTITLVSTNSAQNGRITTTATNLTYTPPTNYVGTDTFIYVVNDGHGGSSTGTVFILLALPQFGILAGPTVLNPQTGLFEQNVTVTNIGATTVAAVRLSVVGLRTNVALYNATGTNAGLPYVQYNSPLNPGQNVKFVLEYYVPDRRPLTNTFIVEEVLPAATGTNSAVCVPIDKEFMDLRIPGGTRFVIEFTSIPGRTYTILYSGNLTTWNAATPAITANATKTQWYDDGPPKTDSPPLSVTNRFYRVLVAPANP